MRRKHRVAYRLVEIPELLFHLFVRERFLVQSAKPRRASIHPRYRAWLDGETGHLRFAARDTRIDRHAIPSQWALLILAWLHRVEMKNGEPQYTELWAQHDQVYGARC
jgi:hypothetical protein